MIIRCVGILIALIAILFTGSPISASSIVDVPLYGPGGSGGTVTVAHSGFQSLNVGCITTTPRWQAQSFQVSAGQLTQITLGFGSNSGTPPASLDYIITTSDTGMPGTSLGSASFTPSAGTTAVLNTTSLNIFLYDNTLYWLVLKPSAACSVTGNYALSANSIEAYAGGVQATTTDSGIVWAVNSAADFWTSITTSATGLSSDLLNDKVAQSFTVGGYVTASAIKLHLKKFNSPTGVITLNIESDVGNSPSGYLIADGATGTYNESDLTTDYALTTIDLDSPINLQPGIKYWIVITTDREDSTDYVALGSTSECIVDQYLKVHNQGVWKGEDTTGIFEFSLSDTPEQPVSSNSANIATLGALIILIVIGFGQVYLLLRVGQ